MEHSEEAPGPLSGLRVLDASTVLAGPLAAQILGDFGADVVKVEHPSQGDSMRGHGLSREGTPLWWKLISRNKRCLGLDLGNPRGAEVFRTLAATADVIIENFRPGTIERWGLGYEALRADNPGLVLVRVTGFGQEGPYSDRPAFGTLIESMSGFAAMTGEPGGPPTLPPFGLADSIAGLAAVSGALMALRHRDATGDGQVVDLAILEPMLTALGPQIVNYDQLGVVPERLGNRSANNAPRNTYRTSDGHWAAVSSSANAVAGRVMRMVGHPELTDEPWFASGKGRAEHADLIDMYVGEWIAARTLDQVIAEFGAADVAVAPVYDVADLFEDPQVAARQTIAAVADPDLGEVRMQNLLFKLSESPGAIRWTGRSLGADTDAVLVGDLGLEPKLVEDLRAEGIVA